MFIDKKYKLWKACAKDEMRPALNYIHFKNGFTYASNSHILAKVELLAAFCGDLDEIDECKRILDGYAISASVWKFLATFNLLLVKDNAEKPYFEGMIENNLIRIYAEKSAVLNTPKFEDVLSTKEEKKPISRIGIDPALLADISDALGLSRIRLDFLQADKKIFIHANGLQEYNNTGIIMPQMITETLPGFDE